VSTDEGNVHRSRRRLLVGGVALAFTLTAGMRSRAGAAPLPEVTVYKAPS
jgi:hypothetical protein